MFQPYLTYQNVQKAGYYFFLCTLAISGCYLIAEITFLLGLDYPFNIYEPEVAIEAWHLSNGNTIYNDPKIGPPAGLYAPWYQLTGAFLFQFLPQTLPTLRFISLVSLLIIAYWIWKLSGRDNTLQLLFVVIIVLMWHPKVLFFDLHAKPDSYSLLWVFGSIYLLNKWVDNEKIYVGMAASLCLVLAFFTKQTMLFAFVGAVTALILQQEYRKSALLALYTILLGVVAWFLIKNQTGDYIFFYLFELPRSFDISYGQLANSFYALVTEPWFLLAIFLLIRDFFKNRWTFLHTLLSVLLLLSLGACTVTAAKDGGLANAYQPFYLLVSVIIGIRIPVEVLLRQGSARFKSTKGQLTLLFLIPILLLGTITLNPAQYISRIQNRLEAHKNYQQLATDLKKSRGTIFVPYDNYLSLKAEKPVFWSFKSERDLHLTNKKPDPGYRELAITHDHVITVHIANYENSMQLIPFLKDHGYILAKTYPINNAISYKWWEEKN